MSGIATRKSTCFCCCLNDSRDGAERTDAGKLFHVRGPVTGNERSPTVTNRDRGTKRISVSADELSRRLESMSTTRWWCDDDRYGGARSWRQQKTKSQPHWLTHPSDEKCSDRVGRQLHDVHQSHVHHAVGLRAAVWPVLVAFYLQHETMQSCE